MKAYTLNDNNQDLLEPPAHISNERELNQVKITIPVLDPTPAPAKEESEDDESDEDDEDDEAFISTQTKTMFKLPTTATQPSALVST